MTWRRRAGQLLLDFGTSRYRTRGTANANSVADGHERGPGIDVLGGHADRVPGGPATCPLTTRFGAATDKIGAGPRALASIGAERSIRRGGRRIDLPTPTGRRGYVRDAAVTGSRALKTSTRVTDALGPRQPSLRSRRAYTRPVSNRIRMITTTRPSPPLGT
jgi:hypothetical protein